jgi:hypothetical protein
VRELRRPSEFFGFLLKIIRKRLLKLGKIIIVHGYVSSVLRRAGF